MRVEIAFFLLAGVVVQAVPRAMVTENDGLLDDFEVSNCDCWVKVFDSIDSPLAR